MVYNPCILIIEIFVIKLESTRDSIMCRGASGFSILNSEDVLLDVKQFEKFQLINPD